MYITAEFLDDDGYVEGLDPQLTAYDLSDNSKDLDGVSMPEVEKGIYKYNFSAFDNTKDYEFIAEAGTPLEGRDKYAYASSMANGDIAVIKLKTDNQPAGIQKNVALPNFPFTMLDSSDHISPLPNKTVTGVIKKDGGAWASLSNSPAYDDNNIYLISYIKAEINADLVTIIMSAPGCDDRVIILKTSG